MHDKFTTHKKLTLGTKATPVKPMFQSRPFALPARPAKQQQTEDFQVEPKRVEKSGYRLIPLSPESRTPIQPKLIMGQLGEYEQSADTVARQVVQSLHTPMPEQMLDISQLPNEFVQRMKANTLQRTQQHQQPQIQTQKINLLKQAAVDRKVQRIPSQELQAQSVIQRVPSVSQSGFLETLNPRSPTPWGELCNTYAGLTSTVSAIIYMVVNNLLAYNPDQFPDGSNAKNNTVNTAQAAQGIAIVSGLLWLLSGMLTSRNNRRNQQILADNQQTLTDRTTALETQNTTQQNEINELKTATSNLMNVIKEQQKQLDTLEKRLESKNNVEQPESSKNAGSSRRDELPKLEAQLENSENKITKQDPENSGLVTKLSNETDKISQLVS
ncbi:hypothetical protein [Nostoc sp. NMS4]|uniref:hypothetical protein n=1 Tax=Nostoc sp. NMS4 TaxID=2815390 RepID=UPI0025FC8CE8|nr:hypothetical protein [Nostoc sp. NMS4]MBN3923564.1 hypothetical protein [Nostoc sp. NMS4]